jgi:hypothetical protein
MREIKPNIALNRPQGFALALEEDLLFRAFLGGGI